MKKTEYKIMLVLEHGQEIDCVPLWFGGVGKPTSSKKQAFKNLKKIKHILDGDNLHFSFMRRMKEPYVLKTITIKERL